MSNAQNSASKLRAAYASSTIPPLRLEHEDTSVELAYQIQDQNTDLWLNEGRRLVGRKIGLTSEAVQTQLGVDQPDYGMLFSDRQYRDSEPIETSSFQQPRIEAEVAFVLSNDLSSANSTMDELVGSVDRVYAGLEIVDSRISDWDISLFDTIADNASFGGFVLGETSTDLSRVDMIDAKMQMFENGKLVSEGKASDCLGNPLNAALWLANLMAEKSRPLQAGDIILSGALGPMVSVTPGTSFTAQIEGLGSVTANFV
ncbi:MAG: fumarylacetoacetate hydrolase family protein [Pseudomonadota bacterium]